MKKLDLSDFKKISFRALWSQMKAEFRRDTGSPLRLACAVGMGFAFGVSPLWGFQILSAYGVATLLKINRVIVLATTNISNPPTIPFIIYYSFVIGGWFLPPEQRANLKDVTDVDSIGQNLFQYLLGSLTMSVTLGMIGTVITYFSIIWFRRKRQNIKEAAISSDT